MELDKIYNKDCLEFMVELPNESIDLIATDPPYRLTSRGSSGTMSGYWTEDRTLKGKIFAHNDIDIKDYIGEFYRILKADSHCYIMCNNLNLPHFFDVISNSEFKFIKLLAWDKQTKICGQWYMGQIEHIFMLRKGRGLPINHCGTRDLLSFHNKRDKNQDGTNIHDSQKPIGLMRVLVENSSQVGGIVLDPFMGSGTTAIACIQSNRHFIGFELDKQYYSVAVNRIQDAICNKNGEKQLTLDL